mgnify:CR=1 FL=1
MISIRHVRKEYPNVTPLKDVNAEIGRGEVISIIGPSGTGKSTLMRKVAEKAERKGYYVERGFCSADPNSLDVVLVPEINFSICDGTAANA